jgi:hypothetical protein
MLKDTRDEAKELMDRYNPDPEDADAEWPWDWTQDLADQFSDDFYAAKDEWQRKKKEVDAIKAIQKKFDDEDEAAKDELKGRADGARDARGAIIEAVVDARIAWEEARL